MQLIINSISLRFSINVRIATFKSLERSHQKLVYKNFITYVFNPLKHELFSKFRGL